MLLFWRWVVLWMSFLYLIVFGLIRLYILFNLFGVVVVFMIVFERFLMFSGWMWWCLLFNRWVWGLVVIWLIELDFVVFGFNNKGVWMIVESMFEFWMICFVWFFDFRYVFEECVLVFKVFKKINWLMCVCFVFLMILCVVLIFEFLYVLLFLWDLIKMLIKCII